MKVLLPPRLSPEPHGFTLKPDIQPLPGKIELLYVGRQSIDNPGLPPMQANTVGELGGFFRLNEYRDLVVFYPYNDHRGGLVVVENENVHHEGSCYGITNAQNFHEPYNRIWMLGYADGTVVDLKRSAHYYREGLTYVLDSRTLDCVIVAGFDGRFAFNVHLSTQTLFGYVDKKKFKESILKQLFAQGIDSKNCRAWLGPAVSGVRDLCTSCYEYTEGERRDGTRLTTDIHDEYPHLSLIGLTAPRLQDGKIDIHLCQLVVELLKFHGVPEENIDMSCNWCTRCHADQWHSDREDRHDQSPKGQKRYRQRVGNHALMYVRP